MLRCLRLFDRQPNWHEDPSFDGDRHWGARYMGATYNRSGEPEQTVGEDWVEVPDSMSGAVPIEREGLWYWCLESDLKLDSPPPTRLQQDIPPCP